MLLLTNLLAQKIQFNFNENIQSIYKENILKDMLPLPIAETTKTAIVNRFIILGKERFDPKKVYSIDEKALYNEMKKIAQISYNEFNDSTKRYWTIDMQMKNAKNMALVVGALGGNASLMYSVSACFNDKIVNTYPNGIKHLSQLQKDKLYHDISKECTEEYIDNINFQLQWEPIVVDQYKATIHKQLKEEIPTLTYEQTKELTDVIVNRMIKSYPNGIPSELAGSEKLMEEYAEIILEWMNKQK